MDGADCLCGAGWHGTGRRPRLAMLLLPGLDHFAHDLLARLPAATGWDIAPFYVSADADLAAALAWTDLPDRDALWFEFCWPPFPRLIAATDFGGRRVVVRVHRIEAMETDHVARTPWRQVRDLIVVSGDMAARVRAAVPDLAASTRVHVIHNGVDVARYAPLRDWDRFRIGWCGLMTLRKNPTLALEILARLRTADPRYRLHLCGSGGERLALAAFAHLAQRLGLADAITIDGTLPAEAMPAWHARNGVLLHTSLHESFGYAIAEAACVGCDLAVLDHPGADEFWPDAVRFASVEQAVARILAAAPHRWRDAIAARFPLDRQIDAVARLLLGVAPAGHELPGALTAR